ncbi:MAG: AmmeMemoRadiSam system protein A [Spirochaetaceae bacterium]|jgi:AmmeMemoRadiSam system protein A|nr:AmmeMemoRadiSam system protein A [Spirochaetaceae bacterium]
MTITHDEKEILLSDARETILAKLEKRSPHYDRKTSADVSVLSQKCGAFVTLHEMYAGKQSLRGCIGRMTSDKALQKTVRDMALEAAFGDTRFPQLTKDEWPHCDIEISVLSPMELCADPHSIEIGVHGLYLILWGRAGVLLPQVPVEQGWDLTEYLDYICRKSGLPPGAYMEPDARLYTFTAEVFSEKT